MTLLHRLRAADEAALAALGALLVDDALDRPAGDAVDRGLAAKVAADVLRAWIASDAAEKRLVDAVERGIDALDGASGPLRDRVPAEVRDGLVRLAQRPYTPSRALVLRLLDREPVRRLLREILLDAVTGFASKVRQTGEATAVGGLATGLGRFALRKSGAIGAIAGEVVGAVGGEVERQMERKAADFVDGAVGTALQRLAEQLADPARAAEQAALRSALLDGVLGLSGPEVAAELRRSDPRGLATLAREALSAWAEGDDLAARLADLLDAATLRAGDRTLRAALDELGVLAPTVDAARALVLAHARRLVATPAFASWLSALEEP